MENKEKERQIQIPMNLYNALCYYHLGGETWDKELAQMIRDGLEECQDRRAERQLSSMKNR